MLIGDNEFEGEILKAVHYHQYLFAFCFLPGEGYLVG